MVMHFLRMGGIIILMVLCMVYPFLPGEYDGLALALSTMAQLFGAAGLLLVPIGVLWLVYEVRKRARGNRNHSNADRGYYFAMASLIVASILMLLVSFITSLAIGISLGLIVFAVWVYAVSRWIPRLKLLKKVESENINPTPLYLIFIPITVVLFQLTFAVPAAEFSRNHVIRNSAEFINEIESHHAEQGRYPSSLLAVNKDYKPSIVGIEKFYYAPNGEAYNLFFEQPRFLLDNFGTREFVVYNPMDEHIMPSHVYWILIWTPDELATRQGWYAVHDALSPHWKYFWFD